VAELDESNFDAAIKTGTAPVVVDFYAPWCGPCKMLAPMLEKLAEHLAGEIRFAKVNVDDAPGLAERFAITGVPTLLFFRNGSPCDRMVGFTSPRDLVLKLEKLTQLPEARA
ncbi:MAG TPA: thioredoxin, partial [Candidatus Paceibacterota bacterium]|nr:thioredoxin [Candidatus Paceibacterota bacterium]